MTAPCEAAALARLRSGVIGVPPDPDDLMAPRRSGEPRIVACSHCRQSYPEDHVVFGWKPPIHSIAALWWCPTPLCDGGGIGFNILPVEPARRSGKP